MMLDPYLIPYPKINFYLFFGSTMWHALSSPTKDPTHTSKSEIKKIIPFIIESDQLIFDKG